MAKNLKRAIAILLSLVMLLSVSSLGALAAEVRETPMGEEARGGAVPAAVPAGNTRPAANRASSARLMAQSEEAEAEEVTAEEKTPEQIAAAQTDCTLSAGCSSKYHFDSCPEYSHDDSHDFARQPWGAATYANCEEYGVQLVKCSTCNKYRYEAADPIEHTYPASGSINPAPAQIISPTCGEEGQRIFYCTRCKAGADAPKIYYLSKLAIHNGTGIIDEDGCPVCHAPAVAKRVAPDGTVTYHASVKNAVGGYQKGSTTALSAAENGSVITLLGDTDEKDIYISSSITLDLGGHTIDGTDQPLTTCIVVQSGAKVTIANGVMSNHYTGDAGAAIQAQSGADVTVTGVDFIDNQAGGAGGTISAVYNVTLTVSDCAFIGNTSSDHSHEVGQVGGSGGAIFASESTVNITDCVFTDNVANQYGGAAYLYGCNVGEGFLDGCSFEGNIAGQNGGAIYFCCHSDLTIGETVSFVGNQANEGGAVYFWGWNQDEIVTLGGTYEKNYASQGGAALVRWMQKLVVPASAVFIGNQATSSGGALYFYDCLSANVSGDFTDNSSVGNGGGLWFQGTASVDISGTFIGNSTETNGGAIYFDGWYDTTKVNISGTFTRNSAVKACGAIYAKRADVTLSDGAITDNTAGTYSGGLLIQSGVLTVEPTMILHSNTAQASGADDIRSYSSTLTLPSAAEMDATLDDGKAVTDWYMDNAGVRWKDGNYTKYTPAVGDTSALFLKAAHGEYFNITYDLDGGTLGVDEEGNELSNPAEYEPGVSEFTLLNPTRTGYTFLGWTGSNGEEAQAEVSVTTDNTGDLSYTANWEIIDYTITYDLNGGTTTSEATTFTAHYGDATPTIEAPTKAADETYTYAFAGWSPEVAETVTANATYVAEWTPVYKEFTVTYDLNGGATTSEATTFTAHYGDATPTIAQPTKAADETYTYAFAGWDKEVAETVTGDATYVAEWTATNIDYTVTYDLNGGTTTSETTTFTAHYGDATPTIEAPTKAADETYTYAFAGWDKEVAGTVTGDATYVAEWTPVYKEFTVTYDLNGGSTTSEETTFVQHYGDATAVINQPTRGGYTFQGWEPAVAETVTGDATYVAQWQRNSGGSGSRPSSGSTTPVEDLEDPDVPLANLPMLNTEDHVAYLVGKDDGTIAPMDHITRGEVATIFFRLLTEESRTANWSTTCDYTDMDGTEYYNNPVSTATKAGLITGYSDGTFGGGNKITRAEMATIAARFLSDPYSGEDLFTDLDGHWASEYINRAAQAGWFRVYNGDGSLVGNFRPDDYITRAEVVVMVNRMLERKVDMDHLLPGMKTWPDNVYSETSAWYYLDIQEASNSHDYQRADAADVESWTELIATPDWTAMEQ